MRAMISDLHRFDHLAFGNIDDIDAVGFFAADVQPAAVGTEHRMLGVLPTHFHPPYDLCGCGVDEQNQIVFLDRSGRQYIHQGPYPNQAKLERDVRRYALGA